MIVVGLKASVSKSFNKFLVLEGVLKICFKKMSLQKQALSQTKIMLEKKFCTFFNSPHDEVFKILPTLTLLDAALF